MTHSLQQLQGPFIEFELQVVLYRPTWKVVFKPCSFSPSATTPNPIPKTTPSCPLSEDTSPHLLSKFPHFINTYPSKSQHKMFWCKPKKDDTARTEHNASRIDHSWSKRIQTQHSERIVINQGYEGFNRLRGEFKRQIQENTNKVRDYTDKLNYLKQLTEVQRLPAPQFYFSTIKKYFAVNLSEWQKDQNSNIIIENIIHVYQELAKSKRAEKELTTCVHFYMGIMRQVLSNEEVGQDTHDMLREYGETMRSINGGLFGKVQDVIKLAKKISNKEKEQAQREEHGLIAEIREMKAQIKGMAQHKCGHHSSNHSNYSYAHTCSLKKEDILPQFDNLRRLIQKTSINPHSHQDRTPKQKVFNRAPQRYEDHQYSREQREAYSDISRYWINQNGVKDIHIAQLQNNVNFLALKLEQAQSQIERLEGYNRSMNIKAPKEEYRKKMERDTPCHILQNQNQRLNHELKGKAKMQQEMMHKNTELSKKIRLLEQRLEKHMKMEEEYHRNMCCLSKKIAKSKELQSKNAELMKEISRLSETIIGLERSLGQIHQKGKPDVNCGRLIAELQAEKRRNKDLSESLQQYREKLESMKDCIDVAKRNIFAGDLLDTRKQEKKFLLETIQKEIGKAIRSTKFIYDFRKHKKTNFNIKIDGHENLVLILKTKNALIGCFYAGKYQHRTPLQGVAILMSLDNKKYYPMKTTKGSQGMIYDYDFLIYGREELMIQQGKQYVTSNFGIDNGYFDNKKDNVHALLREGTSKQAEIVNYQIYQAYFEGQENDKDDIREC